MIVFFTKRLHGRSMTWNHRKNVHVPNFRKPYVNHNRLFSQYWKWFSHSSRKTSNLVLVHLRAKSSSTHPRSTDTPSSHAYRPQKWMILCVWASQRPKISSMTVIMARLVAWRPEKILRIMVSVRYVLICAARVTAPPYLSFSFHAFTSGFSFMLWFTCAHVDMHVSSLTTVGISSWNRATTARRRARASGRYI